VFNVVELLPGCLDQDLLVCLDSAEGKIAMSKRLYAAGLLLTTMCASNVAHAERPSINALQQQINLLQSQINKLQALPHGITKLYDSNDTYIGNYIPTSGLSAYHPDANVTFGLEFHHVINGVDTDGWLLIGYDIRFESFDCSGQGFVQGLQLPGSENVLLAIKQIDYRFFKTTNHDVLEERTYNPQSKLDKVFGSCDQENSGSVKHFNISPVMEVSNPLPYSFPRFGPLRHEYTE